MTLSAKTLTYPPAFSNRYRLDRGFPDEMQVWGRTFGTDKTDGAVDKAITSASMMFDPAVGGFWPCMEPSQWTSNNLSGNWETMRYMNTFGLGIPGSAATATHTNGRARSPRFGQTPHFFKANSLALRCAIDPDINTQQKQNDCHFLQSPFVAPVNVSFAPGVTWSTSVATVTNFFIGKQYAYAAEYSRGNGAVGTLLDAVNNGNGTTTITMRNDYLPGASLGGAYNQIHFMCMIYDTACISTRYPVSLPPTYYGYWELRFKPPAGKGLWPAWWWTRNNAWPPEIDAIETFRENASELDTIHAAVISAVSTGSWAQRYRTQQNYCKLDGAGASDLEMTWGYDLTTGFHTVGMEWCQDTYFVNTLDDTLGREQSHKWAVHANAPAYTNSGVSEPPVAKGNENIFPHMILNYAIGPLMALYIPNDITKFVGGVSDFEIDYVRLYSRKY